MDVINDPAVFANRNNSYCNWCPSEREEVVRHKLDEGIAFEQRRSVVCDGNPRNKGVIIIAFLGVSNTPILTISISISHL